MRYKRVNQKSNKELAIEALEILQEEGIDVSEIAPRRKFNGERRFIYLKEVKHERIGEIIEKYNLDANLKIGMYVDQMRKHSETFSKVEIKRILKLGIKKHEMPLDQQSRAFKNQIQETLYILESLKEEGIDIPFIPRIIEGRTSFLSDIDCPKIQTIVKKLGLKMDFPIGKKITTIAAEYSGNKHDYHFGDRERKRVDELGVLNSTEQTVMQTLDMLEQLQANGIDISKVTDEITLENGQTRRRYLCELEDENIESVIEKLGLQKYCVIGQRVDQVKGYISRPNESREDIKGEVKKRLIELGLHYEAASKINTNENLAILSRLQQQGVNIAKISGTKGEGQRRATELRDIDIPNINKILEEFGIDENYPIGKGIAKISELGATKEYLQRDDFSDEEKQQIQQIYEDRQKEKSNTAVRETINLIKRLQEFGIDINGVSLMPFRNGKQVSLELKDLPLTPEQLEQIQEEFELHPDFKLGHRILNVRQAAKGMARIAVKDEEKLELEDLGVLETKHSSRKGKNINSYRIDVFEAIREAGIDTSSLSATYTDENKKSKPMRLDMIGLTEEKMKEINEKFGVKPSFNIGCWKTTLKSAYRNDELTPEQMEQVEGLGFITELDKLEVEQKALEAKLKEIEQFKAEIKAKSKGRNQKSVGGLDE